MEYERAKITEVTLMKTACLNLVVHILLHYLPSQLFHPYYQHNYGSNLILLYLPAAFQKALRSLCSLLGAIG